MAHAKLSPSSASRWLNCPGSVALCENLPDSSSSAALEGTVAHALAAHCLTSGADPRTLVGMVFEDIAEFPVSDEMAGHVADYCDYINSFRSAQ